MSDLNKSLEMLNRILEERKSPVLTRRERELLDLVKTHLSAKEIAARVGISERTIKFHLTNLYRKYGVQGRQELVCLLCEREP